jgi:hypothetical protein
MVRISNCEGDAAADNSTAPSLAANPPKYHGGCDGLQNHWHTPGVRLRLTAAEATA